MAGESDNQINGTTGPSITEIMEGTTAHGIAARRDGDSAGKVARPVATAPLDARLGQVFNTRDALGDIRDILTWTSHRWLS